MFSPSIRALAAAAALAAAPAVQAIGVTDATGDWFSGYAGRKAPDLDVVGAFVTYNQTTDRFVFSGTMNGDIGTSPGAFYVWGVNRGAGVPGFASVGLPAILFDTVVIFNQDGSGQVIQVGPGAGAPVNLPVGTAVSVGSTIIGQIDGSLLPTHGFAKTQYTWNLWPRDGLIQPFGNPQVSDFAPDATNLGVTVVGAVPEPASALLMALGAAGLLALRRRA